MNLKNFNKFIILLILIFNSFVLKSNNSYINSIKIDKDNNIVAGGFYYRGNETNFGSNLNFALARYKPDGSLDTTFNPTGGQPGIILTNIKIGSTVNRTDSISQDNSVINGIAIDSKNRIVAAGYLSTVVGLVTTPSVTNVSYFAVARYNPDGSLDTTFNPSGAISGIPGIVITEINLNDVGTSVVIDKDDSIIVAGYTTKSIYTEVAVVKYLENGSLDKSFNPTGANSGIPGVVTTNISSNYKLSLNGLISLANAVTLDSKGRILVCGYATIKTEIGILVIRYNPDGSLDTSFNDAVTPGYTITFLKVYHNSYMIGYDIKTVVTDTGAEKIIVAGSAAAGAIDGNTTDVILVRYNENGKLDKTFNSNSKNPGIVLTPIDHHSGIAKALEIDSTNIKDIKIIVGGYTYSSLDALVLETELLKTSVSDFLTLRYNFDGTLDRTFNEDSTTPGYVITPIDNKAYKSGLQDDAHIHSIALDHEKNIVVAGGALNGSFINDFALAKYLPIGKLNKHFNPIGSPAGTVVTSVTDGVDFYRSIFQGATVLAIPQIARLDITPEDISKISAKNIGFKEPEIIAPVNGSVLNSNLVNIYGLGNPNSKVTVIVDNDLKTETQCDQLGKWLTTVNLIEGPHNIIARSGDPISNIEFDSKVINFDVKITKPSFLNIINPKNKQTLATKDIVIMGSATPDENLSIFLNNTLLDNIRVDSNGSWKYNLKNLDDGKYNFSVKLNDLEKKIVFNIDTKPEIEPIILEPVNNFKTHENNILITGKSQKNSAINLKINDKQIDNIKVDGNGMWQLKIEDLEYGNYKIQAISKSKFSNKNLFSNIISINIEKPKKINKNVNQKIKHIEIYLNGKHVKDINDINEPISININKNKLQDDNNLLHYVAHGNDNQSYVIAHKKINKNK